MTASTDPFSAPGLALHALLRQAKVESLKELIGPSTVSVLEGLDPDLAKGDRLGELASELIDPSEALRDARQRDQIISMLPLPKARELAQRLSVTDGRQLYAELRQAALEKVP